jgi:Ca2+-binding RTX toxin-like protein
VTVLRRTLALGSLVACVCIAASALVAATASNTVPGTSVGSFSQAITPAALKPAACAGVAVTAIVTGSGSFQGTAANELVLGSAGPDTINGRGGADCVLGGGGDDDLTGGAGTDVCIGGPGTNVYAANCETQL